MPGTRIARAFVVLVAIAALVAAAAVLRVARIDSLRSSSGAADGTLRALIRALAKEPTRPIEGRLASPIPYAAAALEVKRDPAVDVRLAVLDLEKLAMQDQTPEHDAALGAAYLSIGEIDRAVKHLEQASFASPDVESLQNDLGAAYLARARASARMDDLPRALSAAEHALSISPALLAARFNRALALEHLWLRDAAVAAWEEYVHIDASSAWASEARKHLVVLRMATATYRSLDLTGVSPCVTQFVGRFQQGLMASLRDVRTACPVDPRDESSSGWAAFLEAVGAFYAGDRDGSERVAHKGLSRSRQPQTRGRLLYVLAANEFARGAFPTALDLLTQARALFTSQHDSDGAISVSQMVAEVLRALGERDAAWEHYIRALELVSGAPPSVRTHALLTSVAVASLSQSYPNLAINALNLAEKNASGPSRAAELTDVYLNRARAWSQLGDATSATRDLHAAEAQISYVDDTQIQSRLVAELGSARSEVLVNSEPDNALRAAIQAGDYYRRLGIVFREANVHLSAARAQTRRGDRAAAREQLLQGIDVIEGERARLAEQRARISHLDRVWDLYRDYVELAVADGDDVSALAMLERSRARHTGGVAVDIDSLRRELSTDAVGLVFFQGDGWIGRWTVTRNGIAFTRVPMSAADVAREVGRLRAAILSGTVDAAGNPPTNLVRVLIADLPLAATAYRRLVVVPDGLLGEIPFAGLREPASGTRLIDRVSIVVAPSLSLYVSSERALKDRKPSGLAVAVIPPYRPESGYPPLPGAERESQAIVRLYAGARLLQGGDATAAGLSEALRTSAVVHFAGHAIADVEDPWRSRLLVAPSPDNQAGVWLAGSSAREVRAITVLAACSTAAGQVRRGQGVISIAGLLLAGGAPAVIATLTDIDDEGAADFFEDVHRELARGQRPSDAVRTAQLSAMKRNWRWWSSIVAFGG